jgi:hypothetical protein
MDLIHWQDVPVILVVAIGVFLPEIIRGFEKWKAIARLSILVVCCVAATITAHWLENADVGAMFTRAFLIGMGGRIILLYNDATIYYSQQQREKRKEE